MAINCKVKIFLTSDAEKGVDQIARNEAIMNYSIRKLVKADRKEIDEVYELLNISYEPRISVFFMYRDTNYKGYLTNSLAGDHDAVYIATNRDELIGFAQVKIQNSRIFLNNIIIKPAFRGHHIASGLLRFIIDDVTNSHTGIQALALDVFEKNSDVLNWYRKLGMEVKGSKHWYDLAEQYSQSSGERESNSIRVIADQAGFIQVFAGDTRVGTLINGENLVVRSEIEPGVLNSLKNYFKGELKGLCLITDQVLDHPLIDRSFQLEVPLSEMKLGKSAGFK